MWREKGPDSSAGWSIRVRPRFGLTTTTTTGGLEGERREWPTKFTVEGMCIVLVTCLYVNSPLIFRSADGGVVWPERCGNKTKRDRETRSAAATWYCNTCRRTDGLVEEIPVTHPISAFSPSHVLSLPALQIPSSASVFSCSPFLAPSPSFRS